MLKFFCDPFDMFFNFYSLLIWQFGFLIIAIVTLEPLAFLLWLLSLIGLYLRYKYSKKKPKGLIE